MSDDLLERLKTLGRGLGRQFIIYNEAAEEITRLRAENETLRADNEWLIHTANRLVEALRPFMSGLKGQYPSFTDELPILAGASADDLQFVLKIGNFRLAHHLVEEFDNKNYSTELPILMEYEEKLSRLRAENEKLRDETAEWKKIVDNFILLNDAYKEQIEFWMKEAKEQKVLHEKARELGIAEGRLAEIQQQILMETNIKSSN